ncbi:T9SS type A sorting domain-containing protein [Chryseobacterium sp.]|uniref:T9SS type A sorting domain-containing protein n=1 Tax=Chryseobacterium sp. TaxID=1871047 RepID=UPI0028A0489A|nr:T9SS type A sorting domain-containing protein [Chryseobacterium sp.]
MLKKLLLLLTLSTAFTAKSQITLVNPQPDFSFTAEAPPFSNASQNDIFPIDLNNDGTSEYSFRWDAFHTVAWNIHFCSNPGSDPTRQFIMENSQELKALSFGAAINSSATFSNSWDPWIDDPGQTNFRNQGNKYIGFKATISGTVYYGWILVELVNRTLTIKEYAFTTNASGLTAGQGGTLSVRETIPRNEGSATFAPNPAGSSITIDHSSHTGAVIKITVHDLSGKLMMKQEAQFGKPVDVSSLHSGTYMLRIEHDGITTVKKMIRK